VSAPRLYDASEIEDVPWPDTVEAAWARRFLAPLLTEGPQQFVDNGPVRMLVLLVNGSVLPVVVSPQQPGAADVCSPWSHYVDYPREDLSKVRTFVVRLLARALLTAAVPALRTGQLDRAVYANNWLLATSPTPDLGAADLRAVTNALVEAFPTHAVVLRSVNPALSAAYAEGLRTIGYRFVPSRVVYVIDTASEAFRRNENVRRDRAILARSGYEVVGADQLSEADAPRLSALYRPLYLQKHSPLNPRFTERFFALLISTRLLSLRAMRRAGRIDAFIAYYRAGDVTTGAALGYDLDQPQSAALYRQATAMLIDAAAERGDRLNCSAGAGSFKLFRGARALPEYDAVYDRHLGPARRLAWAAVQAGGRWQRLMARRKGPGVVTAPRRAPSVTGV
jgi:hypothetical protein